MGQTVHVGQVGGVDRHRLEDGQFLLAVDVDVVVSVVGVLGVHVPGVVLRVEREQEVLAFGTACLEGFNLFAAERQVAFGYLVAVEEQQILLLVETPTGTLTA